MPIALLVGLAGAFAALVDSAIGMGYGVLSTSLLMTAGIYPAVASASVHIGKVFTGFVSGGAHLWFGNVKWQWLFPLAGPGAIGGAIGAYLLASLPGAAARPVVAVVMFILGLVVLYRFIPKTSVSMAATHAPGPAGLPSFNRFLARLRESPQKLPALGFVAAFIDAIGGGGWGPIATPGLILTGSEEPRKVIGTVNVAEIFVAAATSATFIVTIGLMSLPWNLIGAMLMGGLLSAPLGAYLCRKLPTRMLGILTASALIGLNLLIVISAVG